MPDRCYTVTEVIEKLRLPRSTFYKLRRRGELPFIEELRPRIGRQARFRADLIDRYLENRTIPFPDRRSA
jgi:excisionase family DNA binding protein